MKMFWIALAAMTLWVGAALANGGTVTEPGTEPVAPPAVETPTTPETTPPTATVPATPPTTTVPPTTQPPVATTLPAPPVATTPMMPSTAVVMPITTTTSVIAVTPGMSTTVVAAACPVAVAPYPTPCAAKTGQWINGEDTVLILGSEEEFALQQLDVEDDYWNGMMLYNQNMNSADFAVLNFSPNSTLTRHGNPNFPYYMIDKENVQVAGVQEQFQTAMPANAQSVLSAVGDRFEDVTVEQAMAMGYQPLGACVQGVGFVYVNQALIDNRFDAMMPEALAFDDDGDLLSVHYILLSDVPVAVFGQPMQPSVLVPGAMQLTVWPYEENPNGMFATTNPGVECVGTTGTEERREFY